MMKRRGFYIDIDTITIGNYYEDGTTAGEFSLCWDKDSVRLQIFDDAWKTLFDMSEFLGVIYKYGESDKRPSMKEVVNDLENLGYKKLNSEENLTDIKTTAIISVFEEYLKEKGVNIENPERMESQDEPSMICGTEFGNMCDRVRGILNNQLIL